MWDEAHLGDAAAEGLGPLAAAKVNQVEATAATKEGGGGRGGRGEAGKKCKIKTTELGSLAVHLALYRPK